MLWQVILAQITGRRTCYSRSQTFVKKHKIMRTFDIRYENGWFFHRSLVKAVRNRQTNEKLKTSVLDVPSDQIQKVF